MKLSILIFALMLPVLTAGADRQTLITINDPAGDDFGAGKLIYPHRDDFQTGNLDLLQLQISRDEEGYWFEAIFRNPIRDPATIPNSVGAESLAIFARRGFYQFNIDLYIDTDRKANSGNTFTLPGRHMQIGPEYAWEKAVVLTPRPELMRQQLLDALIEKNPARSSTETEASLDQSIIFPTRIRVRGKSISFLVPREFFPESDGTDWAVTAFVTGAVTTIPADFTFLSSAKNQFDNLQLGVMQPAPGHPSDTFGYNGAKPSPVVDMLSRSATQQSQQLGSDNILTGVSWGTHAANDLQPAMSSTNVTDTKASPAEIPRIIPVAELFQADHSGQVKPAQTIPSAEPDIAKRLIILQQLFEQKLIDETEFKQQRQRILKEL